MRILFVLLHPGYLRHYESVVRELAQRGHQVHLAFNQGKLLSSADGIMPRRLAQEFPGITFGIAPRRYDAWTPLAQLVRGSMDTLRYMEPRYDDAPELRERVGLKSGSPLSRVLELLPLLKHPKLARWLIGILRKLETAIPSSPKLERFLREGAFEKLVITPLINFASKQEEYVKSARHLGIPVGLCVASWDNLSNKGLIRQPVDSVIVWNEAQKREAVEMHGIPAHRVVVTGAQSYDHWFDQRPSADYAEFCRRVGLDPCRPYILYLCSSGFIGGTREVGFVEKWAARIRESEDASLRDVGILVRLHFQNAKPWGNFDTSRFDNLVIYPNNGANPITESSKADFFDSMYHSAAVVGINTSGMIEAGIVGKPVLTLLDEEFAGTQTGTLHFHHLVEQGLVQVANSFPEHLGQIAEALQREEEYRARNREFIGSFVRPHGLDEPAMPRVVEAIETLSPDPETMGVGGSIGLRVLLYPMLPFASLAARIHRRRVEGAAPSAKKGGDRRSPWFSLRKTGRKSTAFWNSVVRKVGPPIWSTAGKTLDLLGMKETVRRLVLPRLIAASSPGTGTSTANNALKVMRKEVDQAVAGDRPLIVGPWLSEVGYEALYWVPFLRRELKRRKVDPERVVVITRGGAGYWYRDFAAHFLDIHDLLDADAFKRLLEERFQRAGVQKQNDFDKLDEELLDAARQRLEILRSKDAGIIHPHIMYNGLRYFWLGHMGMSSLLKSLDYADYPHEQESAARLTGLPERYYAVRFYFRPSFPDCPENRAFIEGVIGRLAQQLDVVVLNPGFDFDDHVDFEPGLRDRVHRIDHLLTPANNLEVQSRVIQGASAFVGTYGGLSYLPLFYRVPSIAFYSEKNEFVQGHLDLANHVSRIKDVPYLALDTRRLDLLSMVLGDGTETISDRPARRWNTA